MRQDIINLIITYRVNQTLTIIKMLYRKSYRLQIRKDFFKNFCFFQILIFC